MLYNSLILFCTGVPGENLNFKLLSSEFSLRAPGIFCGRLEIESSAKIVLPRLMKMKTESSEVFQKYLIRDSSLRNN